MFCQSVLILLLTMPLSNHWLAMF